MSSDPFRELALASNDHLEQYLRAARGPAPESLAGLEWRGFNLSWRVKLLGLQKFVKGFFEAGSGVEGYNIPVLQNGLDRPWRQQPTPEDPRRYAFYRVTRVDEQSVDRLYPQAILLDYGASPRNPPQAVERRLRDYVVQPDPANAELLLGKAYFAFGRYRLASNFFVIERLGPTGWKP
jgi:hypothetical protein